jgi:hypothetical protein
MAGKRSTPAQAVEHAPPPSGCLPHERSDWLTALPPLPWLAELREHHIQLAHEWADSVDRIAEVRDLHTDAEREFRKQVRDAVGVGEPVPERPAELDPAQRDAEAAVALEDADAARDALNLAVIDVLEALRQNRADIDLSGLSPQLVRSLTVGGANRRAALVEEVRRNLDHLKEPSIELLEGNGPTPELQEASA